MYDGTLLTINSVYSTAVITANHICFDVPAGELAPFLSTWRKLLLGFDSSLANEQKSFDVVKNRRLVTESSQMKLQTVRRYALFFNSRTCPSFYLRNCAKTVRRS